MKRLLDTQQYLDTLCQMLREGEKTVSVPVAGSSMVPFLSDGDTAYLEQPSTPIKRGDIVLYTRSNGRYVLHRVCRVRRDGSFFMVGDAQTQLEHIGSREQVHARVTGVLHRGKYLTPGSLRWWTYRHIWLLLRPLRPQLMQLHKKLPGRKP